jgi:hypothetical protein
MREQFPTLEKVAVPSSGGVAFRIVMAMNQHFAGEARAALLAAMTWGPRSGPQYNLVSWALNSFGVPLDDFLPGAGP